MKDKWRNYALKDGKVQSSYIREYSNRSPKRQAREASRSNRLLESRQIQEEIKKDYILPEQYQTRFNPVILNDAWVVNLRNEDGSEDRIDREREERSDKKAQSGSSEELIMDVRDVSGKQAEQKREAINHQRHYDRISKSETSPSIGKKDESIREENPLETYQEGRQGISCSDKGRCAVEETNPKIQNGEKEVKKSTKEKKHEAKESKAYEKKENKKEAKSKKK